MSSPNYTISIAKNTHISQLSAVVVYIGILLVFYYELILSAGYPPFWASSLILILLEVLLIVNFGMVSVQSLIGALLVYPSLIPLLSAYVFRMPKYALRGYRFQTPFIVNKAVFFVAFTVSIMLLIMVVRQWIYHDTDRSSSSSDSIYFNTSSWVALSAIHLLSSYLTTPGPTILTASYSEVLQNYYPWAAFAGSLYMGSWVMFYLLFRVKSDEARIRYAFYLVTFVGVLWLFLHSRRNESMGVLSLFILDFIRNRIDIGEFIKTIRGLAATSLILFLFAGQVISGLVRQGGLQALSGITLRDFVEGYVMEELGYVAYPGGAHNIYGTLQATIHIFTYQEGFLLGRSFIKYPAQAIPSIFYAYTPYSFPELYNMVLKSHYANWGGGNFIINTYYANFGPPGLIAFGIILGLIGHSVNTRLVAEHRTTVMTGVAGVFIVAMFRSFWYTQLNWIDTLEGFIASYLVYLLVTNIIHRT